MTPHRPGRQAASAVRALLLSTTTKSAIFYAFMGIGFSGAHLLLAKFLPTLEYATVTLGVAILNLTRELAPLGASGVILRNQWPPDRNMLIRVTWCASLVGAVVGIGAGALYRLDTPIVVLLFAGIAAGGVTQVAATVFQSRQVFGPAMLLSQSSNVFLLAAAVAIVVLRIQVAWFALAIIVAGYGLSSVWSWWRLLQGSGSSPSAEASYPWREALSYVFVAGAGPMMVQAERLLTPKMLSLEDLATFGVLAAIVISPYRTLQMGASFTILPRLRAAETVRDRRRLLARELLILSVLIVSGSLILSWLTPVLVEFVFRGKFVMTTGLIWAAILVGSVKAFSGVARASAMALCTTRELAPLGFLVWLSIGIAVAGAAVGASWGLTGLVLGIGAGWLALSSAYAVLAARHFR